MKNSIKKITKLFTLFSLVLLSSCEKENVETTNQKNDNVVAFQNISLKDLATSKTNAKLLESVNNIKKLKPNTQSKVEYNTLYDFYIDQDNGKYIETTDSKTYTFPIYRLSEDNNIENIVFTENPDGSYDVLTTKYDVTKEELEANPNGTELPVDYTIISSKLDAGGGSYIYVDMLMCDNDGFGGTGNPHSAGSNCTDSGHLYTITVIIYVPGSGTGTGGTGSGTGTGGGGNNTTTGGGGTGGTTTSPVGGSYTTAQLSFIKTINDVTEARASFMNSDSSVITAVLNYITTATPTQVIAVRSFLNNANTFWLSLQSPQTQTSIYNYLIQNNFSTQSVSFVNQMINVMVSNPAITTQQFQNWFSTQNVGIESNETQNTIFWNNPSLSFPQQSLPTFDNFYSAYPSSSTTAQQLCTQIGGQILTLHNNIIATGNAMNTCAIRLSFALNYSGITIPNVPNTKLGADGKYYFTFASHMNTWMRGTFGTNATTGIGPLNNSHYNFTKQQILDNPLVLNGLQGIFSMTSTNLNWSSGHCDLLFNNTTCLNNCHFEGPINYVDVWILP